MVKSSPRKSRPLAVRLALWVLPVLFVVVIGGFLAFRLWFNGYLESAEFRHLIDGLTSKYLHARGEYAPLHFGGTAIYSDQFKAHGTPKAAFSELGADNIRAEINLHALWDRSWQIDEITIQRLQASLGHTAPAEGQPEESTLPPETHVAAPSFLAGWLPNRFDLRKILVRETDLKWGENTTQPGSLNGSTVTLRPQDGAWNILLEGGSISQTGAPDFTLDRAQLRFQNPVLYITEADLHYGSEGDVEVSGRVDFEKDFDVLAKINGIPVTPFLRDDWRAKLKGNLIGQVKVKSLMPMQGNPAIEGSMQLAQGEVEALPVLDQIATFTSTERFRRLSLTKSSADFKCENGRTTVTNLISESAGLIRVEGGCTIENRMIDGTFQVGVTPASLQWLPGSQSKVFTVSRDGYLWTTMRLTGPLEHPQEDLTQRLVAAAAGTVIDTVQGVLQQVSGTDKLPDTKDATKKVMDFLSPLLK